MVLSYKVAENCRQIGDVQGNGFIPNRGVPRPKFPLAVFFVFRVMLDIIGGITGPLPLMECTMKTRILLPVMLLSAVFVSPASANWFSNPSVGIDLNIGSSRSPTPDEVRADRQPMLVRDADGNVIAMIDPTTGKMIAIAEPSATAQPKNGAAKVTPASARAR